MSAALIILPCAACQSPGRVTKKGFGFEVIPKRLKDCDLHKHPQKTACGFPRVMCRSGWCITRKEAIDSWNRMQELQRRWLDAGVPTPDVSTPDKPEQPHEGLPGLRGTDNRDSADSKKEGEG